MIERMNSIHATDNPRSDAAFGGARSNIIRIIQGRWAAAACRCLAPRRHARSLWI